MPRRSSTARSSRWMAAAASTSESTERTAMTTSLFGLEGKNALVLGAGQGMGEATAMLLAEAGCNVAVLDLEIARAERVAAQVKAKGRRSLALRVDVLDAANLKRTIERADKEIG